MNPAPVLSGCVMGCRARSFRPVHHGRSLCLGPQMYFIPPSLPPRGQMVQLLQHMTPHQKVPRRNPKRASTHARRRRAHQLTEPGFWSLEKWGNGGKWGEMEKNGGKWRIMNKSRWKMQEQFPQWEKNGGNWRNKGENGGNSEKNGTEYPVQSYFPNFSGGSGTFPTVPFMKINSPHSPTEKWELLPLTDTHRHGGQCG